MPNAKHQDLSIRLMSRLAAQLAGGDDAGAAQHGEVAGVALGMRRQQQIGRADRGVVDEQSADAVEQHTLAVATLRDPEREFAHGVRACTSRQNIQASDYQARKIKSSPHHVATSVDLSSEI